MYKYSLIPTRTFYTTVTHDWQFQTACNMICHESFYMLQTATLNKHLRKVAGKFQGMIIKHNV
jgi:hypothetical protein